MEVTQIDELQEKVGLFENNEGIIFKSIQNSPIYELLKDFLPTADMNMYHQYGNRYLLPRYDRDVKKDNYASTEQAILYALMSEEYNLRTLINTLNLEYDPLDNYVINEQIITTTTISDKFVKGEEQDKMSYSEIKTSNNGGSISTYGEQKESSSINTTYGTQINGTTKTMDRGAQSESGTNVLNKSPYNQNNYTPRNQETSSLNKETYQDVDTINENIGEKTDTVSTSKKIEGRTDSNTNNNTHTQSPYSITDNKGERTDTNDRQGDENKIRKLSGRYGYTTTQALIESERNLAIMNISDVIIKIVLRTICSNVLYMI